MRLEGKIPLIKGATNGIRGELMEIGGATAWLLAREGAMVVFGELNS